VRPKPGAKRPAPARAKRNPQRPVGARRKTSAGRPQPAVEAAAAANGSPVAGPVPKGGICVLGMHRSGTSLVARVINLLGVDLGSEEGLLEAAPDNPTGYWESEEILALNDEILATFGGRWDSLPVLPEDWHTSQEVAPLRRRARELLRERFGERKLWGWKDPRNSITLPFWQDIVRGMHYVICVRNPVDVADSLDARGDSRSGREQVEDWLRHTALALHYTASRPRIVVHFDAFFDEPTLQVERLARFVGRPKSLGDPKLKQQVLDFIDPELVHGRTSAVMMLDDERVSAEAGALYVGIRLASEVDALRKVGRDHAPESWAAVNRMAEHLLARFEDGHRREARIGQLEKRLTDIEAEIKKRGRRVQELGRMVEERNRRLAEHGASAAAPKVSQTAKGRSASGGKAKGASGASGPGRTSKQRARRTAKS
jgi:hypothetical protein